MMVDDYSYDLTTLEGYPAKIKKTRLRIPKHLPPSKFGMGEWYCGYVGVEYPHPLFEEHDLTDQHNIDVHGGITFTGFLGDDGWWYFGFDCAHFGDDIKQQNLSYVKNECERLAKQLKKIEEEN